MMKKIGMSVAVIAVIAVGVAVAQGPGFGCWGANSQANTQNMMDWRLDQMSKALNLTDAQKQQAKVIFDNASAASQALQPALLQAQTDLRDAAKTGKDIDRLAAAFGTLAGKMRALHTTAFAQFYNILTAAQRDQLDKYPGAGFCVGQGNCPRGSGMGMMMGRGFGAGRRP